MNPSSLPKQPSLLWALVISAFIAPTIGAAIAVFGIGSDGHVPAYVISFAVVPAGIAAAATAGLGWRHWATAYAALAAAVGLLSWIAIAIAVLRAVGD